MKKFLVAILALLYISTSTGATLHMHYCMGKFAGWGFGHNDSKKCDRCGMDETGKGCCTNENKFVKNNADQKITESAFQSIQLITVTLPPAFVGLPSNNFYFLAVANPINNAPPWDIGIAVYIRNCVFLI